MIDMPNRLTLPVWIPFSERAPDNWQTVVVHNPTTGWRAIAVYNSHGTGSWTVGTNGDFQRVKPTEHVWYPIPVLSTPPEPEDA